MKKYLIISVLILSAIFGLWFLYRQASATRVIVKFKELRPFEHHIPVYYKGIIIGKAYDRRHSNDLQHTEVRLILYPRHLKLPDNTKVLLKKEVKHKFEHDYIELIYPQEPSSKFIHNGTVLEGKATVDLNTYMKNQDPDDLDIVKTNLTSASENLNMSLEALAQLFVVLQDLIKANESNLVGTTGNLKQASGNISRITSKVDQSINSGQLSNTFTNIETSTGNLQRITGSAYDTAQDVNKTMPAINSTIKDAQDLITNTNAITCGIRQTLRKPFGGLRLIFGKTINEDRCTPCGSKR